MGRKKKKKQNLGGNQVTCTEALDTCPRCGSCKVEMTTISYLVPEVLLTPQCQDCGYYSSSAAIDLVRDRRDRKDPELNREAALRWNQLPRPTTSYVTHATKIWLDDQIGPSRRGHDVLPQEWVWVTTVKEVTAALDAGFVTEVHLDYFLSNTDPGHTGMDVLDYILHQLKMHQRLPPKIHHHTGSFYDGQRMTAKIAEIEQYAQALRSQRSR